MADCAATPAAHAVHVSQPRSERIRDPRWLHGTCVVMRHSVEAADTCHELCAPGAFVDRPAADGSWQLAASDRRTFNLNYELDGGVPRYDRALDALLSDTAVITPDVRLAPRAHTLVCCRLPRGLREVGGRVGPACTQLQFCGRVQW
jgi:hypothetical protein